MNYIYDKVKGRNKRVFLKDASIELLEEKIKVYKKRKFDASAYGKDDSVEEYVRKIRRLQKVIRNRKALYNKKLFLVNL